jgi:integrase
MPFIALGINAGLRRGEILNLKWKHVNFENRYIIIQSEGEFRTKTRDFRTVPMNQALFDDLMHLKKQWPHPTHNRWQQRMLNQMTYVICKEDGSRVNDVKTSFRAACKKAGLKGVSPHTMRHTYASHLVMAGTNLRVVQQYLGHTNIQTTMRYSHLSKEHLANQADAICFRMIVDAPVVQLPQANDKKGGN